MIAYLIYGSAAVALLVLPRRLGLSMRRIGVMLTAPSILFAVLMLATNRITEIRWAFSELPFILSLFLYLLAVSFVFLSAPLIITALTTEYLRLYRGFDGWRLSGGAAVLCLATCATLRLPWASIFALSAFEAMLVAWMELRNPTH